MTALAKPVATQVPTMPDLADRVEGLPSGRWMRIPGSAERDKAHRLPYIVEVRGAGGGMGFQMWVECLIPAGPR